jgi:hypothetical protein
MAKIIKLTEADLQKIVKRVIKEQNAPKTITIVTPGQTAEGEIIEKGGKKTLKVRTESGREQSISIQTSLPNGKFMFEMGKDGKKMFGYHPTTKKKIEIVALETSN